MLEQYQTLEKFIENNPTFVTWGVVVVLVLAGILMLWSVIKEFLTELKLNYMLKHTGRESIQNAVIHDNMEGSIFIEHLILTPHKILLLSVKKYRGLIFAAETIDLWTQVVGKRSYKFENPLHQLESDVLALNSYLENTKIESRVLFVNGSQFPKGKPDNIVTIQDLKNLRKSHFKEEIPDTLKADWKRLLDLALKNDKGVDILLDKRFSSGLNLVTMISIMSIISLWLAWRLV